MSVSVAPAITFIVHFPSSSSSSSASSISHWNVRFKVKCAVLQKPHEHSTEPKAIMANWISSKLKAAESILQQIDQQAAESLKKGESVRAKELNLHTARKNGGIVPLKDQLKKRSFENNDYLGKLSSDPNVSLLNNRDNEISSASKPLSKPESTVTDGDWTELLGTPNQPSTSAANRSNGTSSIRGLKREGRRHGSQGSNMVAEVNRSPKGTTNIHESSQRSRIGERYKFNGRGPGSGSESSLSDSMSRYSGVDLKNGLKVKDSEGKGLNRKEAGANLVLKRTSEGNHERDEIFYSKEVSSEESLPAVIKSNPLEMMPVTGKAERVSDIKIRLNDVQNQLGSTVIGKHMSDRVSGTVSDDVRRISSTSDQSTGSESSDTDSGSSSDSASEHEREERKKRRQKILAERAAAKAVQTIKEQENMVCRLEGEKESLQKIMEDRVRQQAQEASELQTSMMETMDAVELEKQKHDNTRMEALARLSKLETANADLARCLATAQRNLGVEVNWVAELRQQIASKEVTYEELRRRISSSHQSERSIKQFTALQGVEYEKEILEAEYSLVTDKVLQLQEKAKSLKENIEMVRKEIKEPTEVEIELKRRLGQMTDYLIQKQAQVETLSSEKATLTFRIEAVTRLLEEHKSMLNLNDVASSGTSEDLESGTWDLSGSKLMPLFEKKINSGKKHLGYLVQQFDALCVAGAVFIRRNPAAKLWSLIYLVCLHFWVTYILFSHLQATNETKSGAVVSLENINAS